MSEEPTPEEAAPDLDAQQPDEDAEPGDDQPRPSTALAPQQMVHRQATPPDAPRRTGIFVDIPTLRAHVGDLLRLYLGGYQVDAFGNMTFVYEGARIFITVGMTPIGPQIGVFSITNLEVDLTPELARFLLTTNHSLGFGAFSYDPDNRAVWLRHSLLGTTLDAPELHSAVAAVASTAAHFDEAISTRFGGRNFNDAPPEVQRSAQPPPTSGYL